ncbi:late secretory pathway protein avl9 [Haplosporangium sp. Z 27]|nr:late secretory pathway protein avl9 [Haplosporangium sp. Z 27]
MGVILHIIVVGFHHAHGPIVEYAFPPFPGQTERTVLTRLEVPEEWSLLPFLALPDGSHQSDEDFTYFHLPPIKGREDTTATLFGISCNRQILTKDLIVKTDDVTRSSVQKAVPIFGILRQRLAVVTAAWFNQKDFTQTDILAQFYDSLTATVSESIPDSAFMMGTSLRELVKKFKYKVLVLLKLLLLEKRVIFFGYPVETLCTYQYSLISLIPGLLKSLQDTGSPLLDSQELYMQSMSKTPAQSTDKQALFKYLGLPLHIFGETEPGTIEFLHDSLSNILSLTSADRRWMDEIIEAVNLTGDGHVQTEYSGSDDYLRAKFEEYILTLLSSVKHSQFTQADDSIEGIGSANDKNLIADYGIYFVRAWQQTPNYHLWNDYVDWELLNEIVAPGHPCQGNFSLAHVQRRLANQFKDMRIDKNLAPFKQSFSRAVTTSRVRLSNVFDSVWQEFEKLQPEDGVNATEFEPGIYSPRRKEIPTDNKGLVRSASTKPLRPPTVRAVPDEELSPDHDMHDAIIPPNHRDSLKVVPSSTAQKQLQEQQQQQEQSQRNSLTASRASSTSSPVSSAFNSTLGPATAATAALGQKAAGMFSNVSSFFQAKKKEIIEAQREAEEQYQQRIHQHERKQKVMQERARATASTFAAISPKPVFKQNFGSGSTTPATASTTTTPANDNSPQEVFVYVPPKTPTSPREGTPSSSLPTISTTVATSPETVSKPSSESVPIIAPIPTLPSMVPPTLTRGGSGGEAVADKMADLIAAGDSQSKGDLDQQSLKEIEKELQEALEESESLKASSHQHKLSAALVATVNDEGLSVFPKRSLTPAESYSPFLEVSVPSSPFKPDTDPLGISIPSSSNGVANTNDTTVDTDDASSTTKNLKKDDASLGEALPTS